MPERINLRVTRRDGVAVTVIVRVNQAVGPRRDEWLRRVETASEGYSPLTGRDVRTRATLDDYLGSVTQLLSPGDSALVDALSPDARKMLLVLDVHGDPPNPIQVRLPPDA